MVAIACVRVCEAGGDVCASFVCCVTLEKQDVYNLLYNGSLFIISFIPTAKTPVKSRLRWRCLLRTSFQTHSHHFHSAKCYKLASLTHQYNCPSPSLKRFGFVPMSDPAALLYCSRTPGEKQTLRWTELGPFLRWTKSTQELVKQMDLAFRIRC